MDQAQIKRLGILQKETYGLFNLWTINLHIVQQFKFGAHYLGEYMDGWPTIDKTYKKNVKKHKNLTNHKENAQADQSSIYGTKAY